MRGSFPCLLAAAALAFPASAGDGASNEVRPSATVRPASSTAPRVLPGFGPKPLPGPGGATPVAPPERRFLDMAAVRAAGPGFSTRLDTTLPGARPCATAQRDASTPGPKNVMTTLDCRGLTPPHGQKADVDLYRGLQLRNGWRVRAARVESDRPSSTSASFKVNRIPQPGSTDLTSQLHLWAGPNDFIGTFLIVEIEGPAGTAPF